MLSAIATTPLKLGGKDETPNLDNNELKCGEGATLVKISANCDEVGRYVN